MRTTPFILLAAVIALVGCSADVPLNPSFPLTAKAGRQALEEMETQPKALRRPVVVLAGYADVGFASSGMKSTVKKTTSDQRVLGVQFFVRLDFDAARDHLLSEIERAFPTDDPRWTTEVDVIAFSMGGLVARYAALPVEPVKPAQPTRSTEDVEQVGQGELGDRGKPGKSLDDNESDDRKETRVQRKQLKIARLFTISSPHRGARSAWAMRIDPRANAMGSDSSFLKRLNAALGAADYELFCYVRLNDWVVGPVNAAPPVASLKTSRVNKPIETAWWVAPLPFTPAHISAHRDPRILADILRRLRNEPAYATRPSAPLP